MVPNRAGVTRLCCRIENATTPCKNLTNRFHAPGLSIGYGLVSFLFKTPLNTCMRFKTFSEYVQWKEGLLAPDKPRWVGMPRINTTGMTNQQRRNLMPKKPPKPKPAAPTVRKVAEIVPQKTIPKLKPLANYRRLP